jgi:methanogenic corrinoid protein MtbC1
MSDKGQMIYDIGVRLAWKIKRGNGYTNMYLGTKDRPFQFVTRAKSIDHINRSPEMIAKMMSFVGATGKAIFDFYVKEEFYRKEISKSFAHKEKEYNREFGE